MISSSAATVKKFKLKFHNKIRNYPGEKWEDNLDEIVFLRRNFVWISVGQEESCECENFIEVIEQFGPHLQTLKFERCYMDHRLMMAIGKMPQLKKLELRDVEVKDTWELKVLPIHRAPLPHVKSLKVLKCDSKIFKLFTTPNAISMKVECCDCFGTFKLGSYNRFLKAAKILEVLKITLEHNFSHHEPALLTEFNRIINESGLKNFRRKYARGRCLHRLLKRIEQRDGVKKILKESWRFNRKL